MSHLLRGVHIASKQLAYLFIIVSVLFLLLLGSLYWLSQAIEQRQDEISNWLSKQVDYPVTLGSASLQQLGFMPKLHIEQLKLLSKNSDTELLSVGSLYLGVDIVSSIRHGEPILDDITVQNITTSVIKDENGTFSLKGFNTADSSSPSKKVDWFNWLQSLNHLNVESTSINYTDHQTPVLSGSYEVSSAVLNHEHSDWSVNGGLLLPASLGESVQFHLKAVIENSLDTSVWKATSTLKGAETSLFSHAIKEHNIAIKHGSADIAFTIKGEGHHIDKINSSLHVSQLQLVPLRIVESADLSSVLINKFDGTFEWQHTNTGWQLHGQKIVADMNGELWPETEVTVKKEGDEWLINSDHISLSDLSTLALLTDSSPEIIRKQKPAGELEQFMVHLSAKDGLKGLAFNLKEGAFLPWQEYPGVSGLTVAVNWNNGLSNIEMNSHNLHLYAEQWLDKAIFFDSVTGSLRVQHDDDTLALQSEALRVWNDELTLQLDGNLEHTFSGRTQTDLQFLIENMAVNSWKHYVPQRILEKDFKEWANPAFVKGTIVDGKVELLGDLADFPFDKEVDAGYFKMALNVEDAQLHFAPDWPDILGMNATITGLGNDLVIKSNHGTIAGFKFIDVTTAINRLMITKPVLTTNGTLKGTTQEALEFVKNSPLKERFARAVEGVEAKGESNIKLDLLVPLTNVNSAQADGTVSFKNSELSYQEPPEVSISNINGILNFSGEGVDTTNAIQAVLFNEKIDVTVTPNEDKTVVTMNGFLNTQEVNKIWPKAIPAYISGRSSYIAKLNVKEKQLGDFYIDGGVSSNLQGLEIELPKPLGKGKAEQLSVDASVTLTDGRLNYSLNYDQAFKALATKKNEQWLAGVMIGSGVPTLPTHGIHIQGQLQQLSVDKWLTWINSQPEGGDSSFLSYLDKVSIEVASLTAYEHKLTNLNYLMDKQGQGWQVSLSSDQMNGTVFWPNDLNGSEKLSINVDKLAITLPKESNKTKVNTELWPAIDVSIGELSIDDLNLGKVELSADKNEKWLLNSATLQSEHYTASFESGGWLKTETGDLTQLTLKLESDNLGSVLEQFGYQKAIDANQVEMLANLNWVGTPLDFSREHLNGELELHVGKGKLNDIEPGAAGRVFGLMSVAALPRRLALDFSDLFAKGFNFDAITGSFQIEKGVARTDDFVLKGPSAKVEITGAANLVLQEYDQQVKITPNVSSTLPLAGAVAGGPVGLGVGAALLVVDKLSGTLFGKNIVNLISYSYTLTGPWDNPEFNVLQTAQP